MLQLYMSLDSVFDFTKPLGKGWIKIMIYLKILVLAATNVAGAGLKVSFKIPSAAAISNVKNIHWCHHYKC